RGPRVSSAAGVARGAARRLAQGRPRDPLGRDTGLFPRRKLALSPRQARHDPRACPGGRRRGYSRQAVNDRRTRISSASVHWLHTLDPRGSDRWPEEPMQPRRIYSVVAALGAAHVAAGVVSNLLPRESRALFLLCLITLLSMIASAFSNQQPRRMI